MDGPHAVHPIQCLVYLFEDKEICASGVLFVEVLDAMELDSPTHTTHKLKLPNMVIPLQYPRYPRYPHKGYGYVGGNNSRTLTPTPHTLQQKPGGFQNPCHSLKGKGEEGGCHVTVGTFARRGLSSTAKTLRSLSGVRGSEY